ncbi:MAG: recombinase family protein [Bacilli bacterium]|uniref:recombinase family protein n=1 Tax=Anaerorhabdus sp. TaxID=1872524 RepID=UPI002FC94760
MSNAISWSYKRKYEQGIQTRKTKCFGYDYNQNGDRVVNAVEAGIVRFIYNEYVNGNTAYGIAKVLNNNRVKTTKENGVWRQNTIMYILRNEVYIGYLLMPKTMKKEFDDLTWKPINGRKTQYLVEESHEAIIPIELFERIQCIIKERTANEQNNKGAIKRKYTSKNPLLNVLVCKDCGSSFRRVIRKRKGIRIPCWVCATHAETGVRKCANKKVYKEDEIIEIISKIENDKLLI